LPDDVLDYPIQFKLVRHDELLQAGDEFALKTSEGVLWYPCQTSVGTRAGLLSTFPGDIRRRIR
jgi:hypothetical protein